MITDDQRALLNEAKTVEHRRVELCARAIEERIADLLPEAWGQIISFPSSEPVEIRFDCGLELADVETFTDRECREFVGFIAGLVQEARVERRIRETDEDDGA